MRSPFDDIAALNHDGLSSSQSTSQEKSLVVCASTEGAQKVSNSASLSRSHSLSNRIGDASFVPLVRMLNFVINRCRNSGVISRLPLQASHSTAEKQYLI